MLNCSVQCAPHFMLAQLCTFTGNVPWLNGEVTGSHDLTDNGAKPTIVLTAATFFFLSHTCSSHSQFLDTHVNPRCHPCAWTLLQLDFLVPKGIQLSTAPH